MTTIQGAADDNGRERPPVAEAQEKPAEVSKGPWVRKFANPELFDYKPYLEGEYSITLGEEVPEVGDPFQARSSRNVDKADLFEDVNTRNGPVLMLLHIHGYTFYVGLTECDPETDIQPGTPT